MGDRNSNNTLGVCVYTTSELRQLRDYKASATSMAIVNLRKNNIYVRKKTKRGTRGGRRKPKPIPVRVTHHEVPKANDPKDKIVNKDNLIQLSNKKAKHSKQNNFQIVLFNARSVCNKTAVISDIIIDNKVDMAVITETWLDDNDQVTLNDMVPNGYSYELQNRKGRGGGLIVIFNQSIDVTRVTSCSFNSFEHIETTFKSGNTMYRMISVYRPPPSQKNKLTSDLFMSEFQDFIIDRTVMPGKTILLGDFNFHVDNKKDKTAQKFLDLVESFNLKQHVNEQTHIAGHTLDLVFSNTKDTPEVIHNVRVDRCGISDHYNVFFQLSTAKPGPVYKTISYRKTKSIDMDALKADIVNSGLQQEVITVLSVRDKVKVFSECLCNILDKHAPQIQRKIVIRPNKTWYNDNIRASKIQRRSLEKLWRQSGLEIHRQMFNIARNETNKMIFQAKQSHVRDSIAQNKNNTKELFRTINGLLKNSNSSEVLPPSTNTHELAETFSTYFTDKIVKIREELDNCEPAARTSECSPWGLISASPTKDVSPPEQTPASLAEDPLTFGTAPSSDMTPSLLARNPSPANTMPISPVSNPSPSSLFLPSTCGDTLPSDLMSPSLASQPPLLGVRQVSLSHGILSSAGLHALNPVSEGEMSAILKSFPSKTCSLDPVPSWIIKKCVDELCPAITNIVNTSLETGEMPQELKKAVVKPTHKKPGLDINVLKNYRPVSNLSFLSKIIEKAVSDRLNTYLLESHLFPKFQSAYRKLHSTETALLRVQNDIVHDVHVHCP